MSIDSLPDQTFKAKVGALSGLANRSGWFEPTATISRLFDVTFHFDQQDPRLKAGASARVFIEGKEMSDALHVPRQAVFEKAGKTHVFVRSNDRFEQREVKVVQRTESRVALEGLPEGTEIALVDPTAAKPAAGPASISPMPGGAK